MNYWPGSLCNHCRWMREIVSGKGSRFLMCTQSAEDERFLKYPPQPMTRCAGHQPVVVVETPPASEPSE